MYYALRFYFPCLSLLVQSVNIIQLLHLNEINMRLDGAEYNNIERGEAEYFMEQSITILNEAKPSSILLYSAPEVTFT